MTVGAGTPKTKRRRCDCGLRGAPERRIAPGPRCVAPFIALLLQRGLRLAICEEYKLAARFIVRRTSRGRNTCGRPELEGQHRMREFHFGRELGALSVTSLGHFGPSRARTNKFEIPAHGHPSNTEHSAAARRAGHEWLLESLRNYLIILASAPGAPRTYEHRGSGPQHGM